MSSEVDLADEAAKLASHMVGAGARFEEACKKVAARDMRSTHRAEAEAFFEVAKKAVEPVRSANEASKDRKRREIFVFLTEARGGDGATHVQATAEAAELKHIRDLMKEKEAYAMPEELFWEFSKSFNERITEGAFDSKAISGGKLQELVLSEFMNASTGWLESKGWGKVVRALEVTL